MSRILEGVFVLGCSLVGLGMGAPDGSGLRDTVQSSIQLITLTQSDMARNVAQLSARLVRLPVKILGER